MEGSGFIDRSIDAFCQVHLIEILVENPTPELMTHK